MEIIKTSGIWWFPEYATTSSWESPSITNSAISFVYNGIIIYEGVYFLLGSYHNDRSKYIVVEATTGGIALFAEEVGRTRDPYKLGKLLEDKIIRYKNTQKRDIHMVIRDFSTNKKHLELWKINMFL